MRWFAAAVVAVCMFSTPSVQAAQDVVNTRHNLSTVPPVGVTRTFASATVDEVCVFCHTPHNALPDAQLWNHAPTSETNYTLYGSSTLAGSPSQPTGKSRLCLACHDGTVALGSLQNPPAGNDMGATMLSGRAHLTTDLSDDHPISLDYSVAVPGELVDPAGIDLRLEGSLLQCTTCHDPHEKDNAPFLQKSTTDGSLCTTCHERSGASWDWATSSHATSTAATPATVWPERRAEWPAATVAANSCLSCHDPHTAAMPARLITKIEENTCYACHNGTVAASDIEADFAKANRHPVDVDNTPSGTGDHDATKIENPLTMPLHTECMDCHNPHGVKSADPMISFNPSDLLAPHANAPAATALIKGITGLDVNGNPTTDITNQYELCFKCHGRPGQNTCGGDRCGAPLAHGMIRVDMVSGDPRLGGVQVDRNIRDRVVSGTAGLISYHPIEANNAANNNNVPTIDNSTLGTGLNSTTTLIYCTDCHNSDTSGAGGGTGADGPHGSTWEGLLAQQYTFNTDPANNAAFYALCYKCHDQGVLLADVTNFPHSSHIQSRGAACINCHDPHGSHAYDRLLNFLWVSDGVAVVDCIRGKGGGTQPCSTAEPYQVPTWVDNGTNAGECWLDCHNAEHSPKTYN